VTTTVSFADYQLTVVPVSTLRLVLLQARAGEPISPLPSGNGGLGDEYLRGLSAGILLALDTHGDEWGIPEGKQLAAILREGGWIAVTPDGLWHFTSDADPVRIVPFLQFRK